MKRYLIIGYGITGATAAEVIRQYDRDSDITIVTEEDIPLYTRIRLNEYIADEISESKLIIKKNSLSSDNAISVKLNTRITGSVTDDNIVITENNEKIPFDHLLVAAGSHSFVPPIKGADKKGVFTIRNIKDARDLRSAAESISKAVIIGGGLLGLEVANALRKTGKDVTVVEFFPRLLPRQLDVDGAKKLQNIMEGMGFSFRLDAKTKEISGDRQATGVLLESGEEIPAELVIISAGVRPNLEIAGPLGLDTNMGIKVDAQMRTNRPNIFAAGDVAEVNGALYGIWPAAMDQGKIAGLNMAGENTVYEGTTMANTLKVVEIDLASAGNIDADNEFESQVVSKENIYKKVVFDKDRIIGCIMLGRTKGFRKITQAMGEKKSVSTIKDQLLSDNFDFRKL